MFWKEMKLYEMDKIQHSLTLKEQHVLFTKVRKVAPMKEEYENKRFYSLLSNKALSMYLFRRPSSSDCSISSKRPVWHTRPEFQSKSTRRPP